jgi:XTP/dITP diphosphohydrolase
MDCFLIATGNEHKVREIRHILGNEYRYLTLRYFPDAPQTCEDATTFAGNAVKKAEHLAGWLAAHPERLQSIEEGRRLMSNPHIYILADDSGLEVDALEGAPGVYSARFAAEDPVWKAESIDVANNRKLVHLLREVPWEKRTARFRCVIVLTPVLAWVQRNHGPVQGTDNGFQTELFEGSCEGHIALEPRGTEGFGYDPLFIPEGYQESFGELGASIKNEMSHRGRALARLKARLD